MAKHRKTRKEKIRSENRQQHVLPSPLHEPVKAQEGKSFSFTFSPEKQQSISSQTAKSASSGHDYAFVKHDLIKTTAVVSSIVIAELLLFVIIK